MIKFNKPIDFDGVQFCTELQNQGVKINDYTSPFLDDNNDFWLDIDTKDIAKAQQVLDAHIPQPKPEPTIVEKLASVGLSIDDLKAALGL